jgi:DNA-binding NarL/FixJ family response regulator
MSTFHDPSYVSEIIAAGASGFLTKNSSAQDFETAIHKALNGETIISTLTPQQAPLTFTHHNGPVLTRREKEVLQLIALGHTNKEIAEKLFVSLSTIDSHRKNILSKFEVMNVASLIAKAGKLGLL